MNLIPNAQPDLIMLGGCLGGSDEVFWYELPIVGWQVGSLDHNGANLSAKPVTLTFADGAWVVLDRATGRAWGPAEEIFVTRDEARAWILSRLAREA